MSSVSSPRAVDRPDPAGGGLTVETVAHHGVAQLVGDADTRGARAEDYDPLLAHGRVRHRGRAE